MRRCLIKRISISVYKAHMVFLVADDVSMAICFNALARAAVNCVRGNKKR